MTIDRKPEASLESSVDDSKEITFTGLERDLICIWDYCSVYFLARKAIDVASAIENNARIFQPDPFICCRKSAVVAFTLSQYVGRVFVLAQLTPVCHN